MSYPNQVLEFFNWTESQQVKLHPQLKLVNNQHCNTIQLSPSTHHLSIIPKDTTIASIPKHACFSHQTSSLKLLNSSLPASLSNLPIHHQPIIRLTIHLTHELSLQSSSPWHPYLNLIAHPEHDQPLLLHLQAVSIPEILAWIKGTEIENLLIDGWILSLTQLQDIYNNLSNLSCSWDLFLKAFTIVSSRAFQIDNFHQLALVPIADLFDHSDQPDVEMVSEDLVCDQCGSSQECIHDSPNPQPINSHPTLSTEDTVELVSIHPLVPPETNPINNPPTIVYNTYGKLSNARLLTEYGFMIDGNTHDRIHFDSTLIIQHHTPNQVQSLLNTLVTHGAFNNNSQDELVANPSNEEASTNMFFIDSNARLSLFLWLSVVLKTHTVHMNCMPSVNYITQLFNLQCSLTGNDGSSPPSPSGPFNSSDIAKHLLKISQSIQKLCHGRLSKYHLPDASVDELFTLKENLVDPDILKQGCYALLDERKRGILGMAIEYACSERILLETCCSLWNEIESALSS